MSRMTIAITVLLATVVSACGASPDELGAQFQESINSQNIESVLGLLADDAEWQVDETPYLTGKTEIENWLAIQAELNFSMEGSPTASGSGVAFESCSISSDMWLYFGINPMTGTCELSLESGLITGFAVQFDEQSMARLSDSPAATSADILGIWQTRNYLTDSGDLYLHFIEQGRGRLAGSPDSSLSLIESDFEGASLAWTYQDYFLTFQNEGPASEKYCQEQDVGIYLVSKVEAGGLKFKTVVDSCSLRGIAMGLPPRWRPHVP